MEKLNLPAVQPFGHHYLSIVIALKVLLFDSSLQVVVPKPFFLQHEFFLRPQLIDPAFIDFFSCMCRFVCVCRTTT